MLLSLLRQAELGPHERTRSMWLGDPFREGPAGDPGHVHALVQTARRMTAGGDTDLALNLLLAGAYRCHWADLYGNPAQEILLGTDEVAAVCYDPRLPQIQAYAAPIRRGAAVTGHLTAADPSAEPDALYRLGSAACLAGDFGRASSLLGASAVLLRQQGRLRLLAQVLETRAWAALLTADFAVAMPSAEESARLAAETAQPLWQSAALIAQAALAALRGEEAPVEKLTSEAERVALPVGATALLALGQYARGLLALGQGRHADAYDHLRRLSEHGDPASHHLIHCVAIGDLAEAAMRSGHRSQAVTALRQVEPLTAQTPAPYFQVATRYARALLADDEAGFTDALRQDMTLWPFFRARLQLAFGEWLRRQRRSAASRAPLRAARDAFDALGVAPWAERARQELRAAGESSQQRSPHALEQLTPQELQIVQLAAEGLSNREIGQRLYLSRRTIESHLYRVFPKLGVTSRGQLPRLLRSGTAHPAGQLGGTTGPRARSGR